MSRETIVKCPECAKTFNYYSSEFRPFCCEKCKMVDLGMWLTENYSLPSSEPLSETDIEVIIRESSNEENH